jgi:hypothetical protein
MNLKKNLMNNQTKIHLRKLKLIKKKKKNIKYLPLVDGDVAVQDEDDKS